MLEVANCQRWQNHPRCAASRGHTRAGCCGRALTHTAWEQQTHRQVTQHRASLLAPAFCSTGEATGVTPSRNRCWGAQVPEELLAQILRSLRRCCHRGIPQRGAARGQGFTRVLAPDPTSRYGSTGELPLRRELDLSVRSSPRALPCGAMLPIPPLFPPHTSR